MKNLNPLLKQEVKGFSLVQVIISLGLMSGLFVVSLKLIQNQTRLGKSASFHFESLFVLDEVKSVLHEPESCSDSLQNKSSIYDNVESINRFNPISRQGDPIFQVSDLTEYSYGQGDVLIDKIELLGETSGFLASSGYTVMKIFFREKGVAAEKFVGEFPIQVKTNELGRIISCQSQPGIHQARKSKNQKELWQVVTSKETGKNQYGISYFQGPVVIGELEERGDLNISDGIYLDTKYSKCKKETTGTLSFDKNRGMLSWCNKNGNKVDLFGNKAHIQSEKIFTLENDLPQVKVLTTKEKFSFCRLGKYKLEAGECWARPTSDGLGGSEWELVAQHYRGQSVKCEFKCYK